jgi:hypothetical protein
MAERPHAAKEMQLSPATTTVIKFLFTTTAILSRLKVN